MSYRIVAVERGGQWLAHAVREDTGMPFGVDCTGATEAQAIDRLGRWLEWQNEHTAALVALQDAERMYHRTVAGAFANPANVPAADLTKKTLGALDAARIRLDDIRSRKPDKTS